VFRNAVTAFLGDAEREAGREVGGDFERQSVPGDHQRPASQRVETGAARTLDGVSGEAVCLVRVENVIDPVTVKLAESAAINR